MNGAYIFMDESGDLGFDFRKSKTSKFFIVTFLFCENKKPIEKIVKKIFSSFTKSEKKFHPDGTIHAYKEESKTRLKVLNLLSRNKDISIISIYLNKEKVYTRLQDEKHVLYNYVTNILLDRVCTKNLIPNDKPITLIASRRETNKFINENFKSYLNHQTFNNHKINIKIEIHTPKKEKCLQIVDMACWSIYRKYEHRDDSFYNKIKNLIVEESPLFP
jgi:hypothetical protein